MATVTEFGNNSSRTYANGISDPQSWNQASELKSFTFSGQALSLAGIEGTEFSIAGSVHYAVYWKGVHCYQNNWLRLPLII